MILPFDPARDDVMLEKWIQHMEELAQQYGWNDRAIMRFIPTRLKGHAKLWYDTRPEVVITVAKEEIMQ